MRTESMSCSIASPRGAVLRRWWVVADSWPNSPYGSWSLNADLELDSFTGVVLEHCETAGWRGGVSFRVRFTFTRNPAGGRGREHATDAPGTRWCGRSERRRSAPHPGRVAREGARCRLVAALEA